MKEIHQQAEDLVQKLQMIANNLGDYNPGLCKNKIPLDAIQYNIGCLGRELTYLFADIGKKIKDESR